MAIAEKEGIEKKFKLTNTLNTTNMVCFDSENRIRKYNNTAEILEEFYALRLQSYQKRKVRY
jgi:DNA topoisomerase-2